MSRNDGLEDHYEKDGSPIAYVNVDCVVKLTWVGPVLIGRR